MFHPLKRLVTALVTSSSLLFVQAAWAADTNIATGTVTDQDNAVMASVQIECLVSTSEFYIGLNHD